jgi:hypothetical protein
VSEARVRAELRVQAMLRVASRAGHYGVVSRRGDPDAGGILVQLRGRDGYCVLSPLVRGDGEPAWLRATGPAPVAEAEADAYVARQARIDPDLWVVEFESPALSLPFPGIVTD